MIPEINYTEMTVYERFQLIRKLANSILDTTTDFGVGACCSDIRVACSRYERDHTPNKEMALPVLDEVLKLALDKKRLEAELSVCREALKLALPHVQFLIARNPQHEEPHKALKAINEALTAWKQANELL